MKLNKAYCLFLILGLLSSVPAIGQDTTYIGPKNGHLVILGGGKEEIGAKKFLGLINDTSASILIIPTAGEDWYIERESNEYTFMKALFSSYGYKNVSMLHTRDKDTANTTKFIEPIKSAKGIWITGGRHPMLADSYLNTKVLEEMNNLLDRNGVIGGTSAGATIMGSYMIRGQMENNSIIIGDHTVGFGWLKNTVIDQHVIVRNRQWDMFEVLKKETKLLGIGVDENTAIVIHNNTLEVIGDNYVAIYDGTVWSEYTQQTIKLKKGQKQFYFLKPGNKYDLFERKPILIKK